jgi:hypothetical protein
MGSIVKIITIIDRTTLSFRFQKVSRDENRLFEQVFFFLHAAAGRYHVITPSADKW